MIALKANLYTATHATKIAIMVTIEIKILKYSFIMHLRYHSLLTELVAISTPRGVDEFGMATSCADIHIIAHRRAEQYPIMELIRKTNSSAYIFTS